VQTKEPLKGNRRGQVWYLAAAMFLSQL